MPLLHSGALCDGLGTRARHDASKTTWFFRCRSRSFLQSMDATTMEDEWFARNMPGNIRTAEPAANEAVPQFALDALYPQQHNNTNNRTFDIQQLMRLNQNSPTSPVLNGSSDSPTHMLLRLLGLIPGNPASGDLPAGLPGVLDTTPMYKRQGLTVDNIDLSDGQLQNIQELLRNNQPNGLHVPQAHGSGLQVSTAEAAYLQHAGNSLEIPERAPLVQAVTPSTDTIITYLHRHHCNQSHHVFIY